MRLEPRERKLNFLIATLTLALIPLGVLLGSALGDSIGDRDLPDCSEWSFDPGAWETSETRNDEALALVRCDVLIGMTRAEVGGLLGTRQRSENEHRWAYAAGGVHDYMGPGDAQRLFVRFDRRDRVRNASLLYGGQRGVTPED